MLGADRRNVTFCEIISRMLFSGTRLRHQDAENWDRKSEHLLLNTLIWFNGQLANDDWWNSILSSRFGHSEVLIAAPNANLNNYAKPINCFVFFSRWVLLWHTKEKPKKKFSLPDVSHDRAERQNMMPNSHQAPTEHVDREQTKQQWIVTKALLALVKQSNKFSINQQITILGNYHTTAQFTSAQQENILKFIRGNFYISSQLRNSSIDNTNLSSVQILEKQRRKLLTITTCRASYNHPWITLLYCAIFSASFFPTRHGVPFSYLAFLLLKKK